MSFISGHLVGIIIGIVAGEYWYRKTTQGGPAA